MHSSREMPSGGAAGAAAVILGGGVGGGRRSSGGQSGRAQSLASFTAEHQAGGIVDEPVGRADLVFSWGHHDDPWKVWS